MKTLIAMIMLVGCGAMGQTITNVGIITNFCTLDVLACDVQLCAFIKENVTTNSYHPKNNPWGENYCYNETGILGFSTPKDFDKNILIVDVHKIKTLSFDYDGKRFVEILSDEIISTKRQRRVTTEEWVDE